MSKNSRDEFVETLRMNIVRGVDDVNVLRLILKSAAQKQNISLSIDEIDEILCEACDTSHSVLGQDESIVDPNTFKPWIQQRKQNIDTPRWDAYRDLLINDGRNVAQLNSLDIQTDEIVELMGDPTIPGSWSRKGLIIGEVQSGKTATYLATLNKAIDYGYKLIVVLGGHTDELRRQTQERFDRDLVGFGSQYMTDSLTGSTPPSIGIRKYLSANTPNVNTLTTLKSDFSIERLVAGVTWVSNDNPTVCIIKKNATIIENVAAYLKSQGEEGRLNLPLVVIDDESDWGSPNTRSAEEDPSTVNAKIRVLLGASTKSTYVAITATPFANIFIDYLAENELEVGHAEEGPLLQSLPDLFPGDYIRTLATPDSYMGVDAYFKLDENGARPHVRTDIEDCLESIPINHRKDLEVEELPNSVRAAIRQFIIGWAIKKIELNNSDPASMLINVSRFKDVQNQIGYLTNEYVEKISMEFAQLSQEGEVCSNSEIASLVLTAKDDFLKSHSDSLEIIEVLKDLISFFQVLVVNGNTTKEIQNRRAQMQPEERKENDSRPTIYIGGDLLSRGLTLKGLMVSYFEREPRTLDTLLQMGRWFGYRVGYAHLVRIWMSERVANDFEYAANASQELRDLIAEMRALNMTPRDFGLRVAVNPDSVRIVAINKSRNADIRVIGKVLWENRLLESYLLPGSRSTQEGNFSALKLLVEKITNLEEIISTKENVWDNVPLFVIEDFFAQFRGWDKDPNWGKGPGRLAGIASHFPAVKGNNTWTVAVMSGQGEYVTLGGELNVKSSIRNNLELHSDQNYITLRNRRLSTSDDLVRVVFSADQVSGGAHVQRDALAEINHPVLLLYVVTTGNRKVSPPKFGADMPLVGVAIAFPKMSPEEAQRYVDVAQPYMVNRVWLEQQDALIFSESDDDVEP